jgi:UDP-N-acetylglucosamine diphosphorylase / glucose-1-phosphate thymidylyltransferase / UDP-N-acetylgalactosamine diphosphorylase / glucosamine-1-phosphate N-acetyltransferase / galactosamine-1-phosphate N-acetyltransferase
MLSVSDFFDVSGFAHAALFENEEVWYVWDPLRLLRSYLEQLDLGEIRGEVMPGAHILGSHIFIGEGTIVEPGAVIKGPAYIGANTEIRSGAYIRERVLVGDHCVVGHTTEIKNSIMLDGSQAGHFAYIGDSILGNAVNLGAGTKLANLKLDRTNVKIKVDGQWVDTGMRKLGAIFGDQVQAGCNTVTNPGTLLGKRSIVYALSSPRGYYPPDSVIKWSARERSFVRRTE